MSSEFIFSVPNVWSRPNMVICTRCSNDLGKISYQNVLKSVPKSVDHKVLGMLVHLHTKTKVLHNFTVKTDN